MATEEQTQYNTSGTLGYNVTHTLTRLGQKLTISNRVVSKLGFWLYKVGAPDGTITFAIYSVSSGDVLNSKLQGSANALADTDTYYEVTFDSPININEEVYIAATTTVVSNTDIVRVALYSPSVKADEVHATYRSWVPEWADQVTFDQAYIYTYGATTPTVTTQAVSSIVTTTATGNGNVTNLGDSAVTQHGHCWNTTGTPDTDDSKTTNGAAAATGAFTSSLTGLTPATKYYVRAYATNTAGTGYGQQVIFIAGAPGSGELAGLYAVVEERFHYVDAYGAERYVEGTIV